MINYSYHKTKASTVMCSKAWGVQQGDAGLWKPLHLSLGFMPSFVPYNEDTDMGAYRNWDLSCESFKDNMIVFNSLFKGLESGQMISVCLCFGSDTNFLLNLCEGKRLVCTKHIDRPVNEIIFRFNITLS